MSKQNTMGQEEQVQVNPVEASRFSITLELAEPQVTIHYGQGPARGGVKGGAR